VTTANDLRAALVDLDRIAARVRRVLADVETDEATRQWLRRQSETDVVAFDLAAQGG
jgi:hypothetical protein